jgi:hypothetical protein
MQVPRVANDQLGKNIAASQRGVLRALEAHVAESEEIYLVRLAATRKSIMPGVLVLTSARCLFGVRTLLSRRTRVLDMPFDRIAKTQVIKRGATYLIVRLVVVSLPPVELRLGGKHVPDRERVAELLANLASD